MANILVVQDVEQSAVDIKLSLVADGHQVLVAKSAEKAIQLLKAASFDLVICGVYLSNGMTMFELLHYAKTDPDRRSMLFVCYCFSPTEAAKSLEESVRATARILGSDRYITQEVFDSSAFRTEIQSILPERITRMSA